MELSFVYSGNETVGAMVVSRLEAAGCTRTDDVAHAEAIITVLHVATALEDAYFDEQGLVQAAGKGALLIDLSASTPSFARELNAVAVVSDLMSVEAPLVVVDVARADAFGDRDNLVCFVGATRRPWRRRVPCWKRSPGTVQETGGGGLCAARARRVHAADDGAGDLGRGGRRAVSRRASLVGLARPGDGARGCGDARGRAGAGCGEHGAFRRHVHG